MNDRRIEPDRRQEPRRADEATTRPTLYRDTVLAVLQGAIEAQRTGAEWERAREAELAHSTTRAGVRRALDHAHDAACMEHTVKALEQLKEVF